jgi:hypothetical protein
VQNKVETKGTGARESETMLRESEGGERKIAEEESLREENRRLEIEV